MQTVADAEMNTAQVTGEVGVRVGMLVGRYVVGHALVSAVADDVTESWLRLRREGQQISVADLWDRYLVRTESVVGGADCADEHQLREVWTQHALRLLA